MRDALSRVDRLEGRLVAWDPREVLVGEEIFEPKRLVGPRTTRWTSTPATKQKKPALAHQNTINTSQLQHPQSRDNHAPVTHPPLSQSIVLGSRR